MVSNTVPGHFISQKPRFLGTSALSAKFSGGIVAVNSVDNSKGLPRKPYRRFESYSVRQLVLSFCGWISSQVNTSTFPWVSRRTAATNVRRERKVGSHLGSFEPLSHVAPLAVRFSLIEKQDASAVSEAMGVTARPIRPTSRQRPPFWSRRSMLVDESRGSRGDCLKTRFATRLAHGVRAKGPRARAAGDPRGLVAHRAYAAGVGHARQDRRCARRSPA
jgi:hypothetical protein